MKAARQTTLLLLFVLLDAGPSIPSLFQRIPDQACVYTPLPEVKSAVDHHLDLPSLAGAHGLYQYHLSKDEGSLGIPLPIKNPLPLCSQ